MVSEEVMGKIGRLGRGSAKEQLEAVKEICTNIFPDGICIDNDAIPALLPILIKFLHSQNQLVQQEGAYFLMAIASSSDDEEGSNTTNANTRKAIEAGVIPNLVKLLSSPNPAVVDQSLMALGNFSADFPQAVFKSLQMPLIMAHLSKAVFTASTLRLLKNLSYNWICIPSMIEANVKPLISLLKSNDRKICEDTMETLGNIVGLNSEVCQNVLDLGVLKFMKELFNRVPPIKFLAAEFLEKASSYGESQINKIIGENILPIIFEQINDGLISVEIKIKYLNVIKNIVEHKKRFFQKLSIEKDLQKLLVHENSEVKELSGKILELAGSDGDNSSAKNQSEKMDKSEEKVQSHNHLEEPRKISRKRKPSSRLTELPYPSSNKKRCQISMANTETSAADSENERRSSIGDFDDIPSRHTTPLHSDDIAEPEKSETVKTESSPSLPPTPPIEFDYPIPITPTPSDVTETNQSFGTIECWKPSEYFISKCCKCLGLVFDRNAYENQSIFSKIKFDKITENSKPFTILRTNDKSGFEWVSWLITGGGKSTKAIKDELNKYYVKNLSGGDVDKILKVGFSRSIMQEHFETMVHWFKCRIFVYCKGKWITFGIENFEDESIPIFVLRKVEYQDGTSCYQIVLSLKNN